MAWPVDITIPQLLSSASVWAVLTGLPLGLGLGLFGRALLALRRRGRLRLYASLWEWARQQDDGSGSALHARRIQRYYRMLRRFISPSAYLAWALLAVSGAALTFALSLVAGGALLGDPAAWLYCWAAALAGAALALVWTPLAACAGALGLASTLFLLVGMAIAG